MNSLADGTAGFDYSSWKAEVLLEVVRVYLRNNTLPSPDFIYRRSERDHGPKQHDSDGQYQVHLENSA